MTANEKLEKLYQEKYDAFVAVWHQAFGWEKPSQLNRFGIVDEEKYAHILFIGKETNGWGHDALEKDDLFLPWLREVSVGKLRGDNVTKHPQAWYNIGRWAKFICKQATKEELLLQTKAALDGIKLIAFTNINKLWGKSYSGKEYRQVKKSSVVKGILQQEIKELAPEVIVLCGIKKKYLDGMVEENTKVIEMPHPSARKSKRDMLDLLEKQLDE